MRDPLLTDGAPPPGPRFEEAVRNVVEGLQESVTEFERLLQEVPEAAYTEGEWKVIENTAGEIESLIDQVQLAYDVVGHDSQAWYDIMQDLPRVTRMLGDTMLLMRDAQRRQTAK